MDGYFTCQGKKYVNEPAVVPFAKYQSYGMGVVYMRPITDKSFFVINYTPHFSGDIIGDTLFHKIIILQIPEKELNISL